MVTVTFRHYEDVQTGERFQAHGTTVEKLRAAEDCRDFFGRPMRRFWARREDTGAEGWITYGEGGGFRNET